MNILVTGGAGFIGSHIVDEYIKLGYKIIVVDDLSNGLFEFVNNKSEFYKIDIRNYEDLEKIFINKKIDIVNHHASKINVFESIENPKLYFDVNVRGTLNLLELARKYKVKRFIFASSGGAIKHIRNNTFKSIYGLNKYICELYLKNYYKLYNLKFVSLRYSNVYGPRQIPNSDSGVISIFCKNYLENKEFKIFGDGKQTRDFVFIKDVIDANVIALNSKVGIFNIGSGKEISILELIELFKKIENKNIKFSYYPQRPGDIKRSCLNIDKTKEMLKWKSKVDLIDGIRVTLQWMKENLKLN